MLEQITPGGELPLPEFVEIEPTTACNLRCIMCHSTYEKQARFDIDVDRLVQNLTCLKGKWVAVGAGYEPLMHPRFCDLAIALSDMEMKLDLVTNGTLLTRETTGRIADCNFENVTVSFDGARKGTYESIRRGANFERTIERVTSFKNSLANKTAYFAINNVLMRRNLDEIIESVKLWERQRFDHIGFIVMTIRNRNALLAAESLAGMTEPLYENLDAAAELVIENNYRVTLSSPAFRRRTELHESHPENFPDGVVRSNNSEARTPFNPRAAFQNGPWPGMNVDCRSPFTFARIICNGNVELCYQFKIGNIYEDDFRDIWYGDEAHRVREALLRSPAICHTCDYYRFCLNAGKLDYHNTANFYAANTKFRHLRPKLVEDCGAYYIVGWRSDYYGLPKTLGKLDVRLDNVAEVEGVLIEQSLDKLKALMVDEMRSSPQIETEPLPAFIERIAGLLGQGCLQDAERLAAEVAPRFDHDPYFWLLRAKLHRADNRPTEALSDLRRSILLEETPEALLELADICHVCGSLKEAADVTAHVRQHFPEFAAQTQLPGPE